MCRATQDTLRAARSFGYGSVTLWGAIFHSLHLPVAVSCQGPITPEAKPPVWAVPLSLATTDGITDLFSFPPVTEMFHFTGSGVAVSILFKTVRAGISPRRLSHSEISGS